MTCLTKVNIALKCSESLSIKYDLHCDRDYSTKG